MPEGPETARQYDRLMTHLYYNAGQQYPFLVNVIQIGNRYHDRVNIEDLRSCLGQRLQHIAFRGKEYFLLFNSAGHDELKVVRAHHMMGGHWVIEKPDLNDPNPVVPANCHFRFDFSWTPNSEVPEMVVYFQNNRFGQFQIMTGYSSFERAYTNIAPGFLEDERTRMTFEEWNIRWSRLRGNAYLRDILMDQHILCSGIGNYLFAEIMWAMKLHPDTLIYQLRPADVSRLFDVVRMVIWRFYGGDNKQIYQKALTPTGYPIEVLVRDKRKIYYSPHEQLIQL